MDSTLERNQLPGWQLALFDHSESTVAFGDTKAALLLTADSILLTGLGWAVDKFATTTAALWTSAAAASLLVVGMVTVLLAISPNPKHFFGSVDEGGGHLTFSPIARNYEFADQYVDALRQLDDRAIEAELFIAIHGKARWAQKKFWRLLLSVWLTIGAIVLATGAAGIEGLAR